MYFTLLSNDSHSLLIHFHLNKPLINPDPQYGLHSEFDSPFKWLHVHHRLRASVLKLKLLTWGLLQVLIQILCRFLLLQIDSIREIIFFYATNLSCAL